MADGSVARRYARALVEIAAEQRIVERIADDLHRFETLLHEEGGALGNALHNPGITASERRGLIDRFLPRLDLHGVVVNFLHLLLDKNRFDSFDAIFRSYREMADERANRLRATVTTAGPITGLLADDVRRALAVATGKEVVVSFDIDPAIIGGLIAKVGDKVFDASVGARLETMKQAMLQDPSVTVGEA